MSVNPTITKGMNHLTFELRFLELEASFVNKHEELLKKVENLSKELAETKLVKTF